MKKGLFGISMLTLTCLYGILCGLVILIVMIAGGDILFAIVGGIIVIIIQFLISPWLTDLTMRWFYKAQMHYEVPDYVKEFISELCTKYGVTYPKIGFIDDGAPNIFTYGRTKKDARIIVTRGIFDLLEPEEIKSVFGHEMGHIVHLDMLFMTACQVVPLVLYAIYQAFTQNVRSDKDDNKLAAIGYIAYLLYLLSQYIILWLSRTREYYADEFSFEETKNPNALAAALVKVGFGLSVNKSSEKKHDVNKNNALGLMDSKTSASLSISAYDGNSISKDRIKNAMKWEMWNPWAKWFEFNSTHPLISKRLMAISKRCNEFNQEPYIVFDLTKTESYVDDFLVEILLSFLPGVTLFASILILMFNYNSKRLTLYFGASLLLFTIFSFIKYRRAHKKPFKDATVESLLGEIKVSHITSVPCVLKGTIIGRGNPGCIFNEDFVIKDNTGIVFLDYNQPLNIINKIFAIFKSHEYFDKVVEVKGWYRRSPVPFVEIYEYTVDGKKKKIFTYPLRMALYAILAVVSIVIMLV